VAILVPYLPSLVREYLEYAHVQNNLTETGTIDLSNIAFIYPSTLLPSIGLVANNPGAVYIPPTDSNVASYIVTMVTMGIDYFPHGATYVPIVAIPTDEMELDPVLQRLFCLNNDGREYGGINAFKYLVGELVTNIYEHSHFHHAYVMAQRYPSKGFVEVCFFDDGATIPGSLSIAGLNFANDVESIVMAVNGLSSKKSDGRGYGLQSNVRICSEGLNANICMVSRGGLLHIDKNGPKGYNLRDEYKLSGTVISIRLPYPAKEVDISEYLQ